MAQVAIVTGGSRGIGAATATLLAEHGWDICVSFRSDEQAAAKVVASCRTLGRRALAVRADVAVDHDVRRLFATTDDELGTVGALVNNAGIVALRARVDEMAIDRIVEMMAVNVVGSFLCAREAVRRMSTRHGGSGGAIVNLSSAAARLGGSGEFVDYAASKGAVDTMTIGLATEVADEAIRVNAVRPGLIETEIHAGTGHPDRIERIAPRIPMRRAGQATEVAEVIAWLCSPAASYVTGALVDVSGGR